MKVTSNASSVYFKIIFFPLLSKMDGEIKNCAPHKQEDTMSFWSINKNMLPYKIHYFLFLGGTGAVSPYVTVFAKNRLGLTATALGAVFTSHQLLLIFTKPIIGFITDYFNKLKWIIFILTVTQGVFYLLLLSIPRIESSNEPFCNDSLIVNNCSVINRGSDSVTDVKTLSCINNSKTNFFDNCSNEQFQGINSSDGYSSSIGKNVFQTYQFWIFTLFLIVSQTCNDTLFTLSDTACYETLQKTNSEFGRQRLWGGVSWGIIAPFAGFLNDFTGSYYPSWSIMAVLSALQLWNLVQVNLVKPEISQNILKDIGNVFSSVELIAFTVGVFMNGMATSLIWFHLAWFFTSIGGSRLLVGLSHTIQCFFGEIPFLFFSNDIIERVGHFNVVTLALFCHGVRFFWYSYFQNPWFMLPIESLHGFTYGVYYAAMTSYGKLSSRPGMEATTQSVLSATYEGIGAGLGCVLFGAGFDRFGGQKTFLYAGIFCACASLINIASTLLVNRQKHLMKKTKTTNNEITTIF